MKIVCNGECNRRLEWNDKNFARKCISDGGRLRRTCKKCRAPRRNASMRKYFKNHPDVVAKRNRRISEQRKNNPQLRKRYYRSFVKKHPQYHQEYYRRIINEISDAWVVKVLRVVHGIRLTDEIMSNKLIEVKRQQIKLRRILYPSTINRNLKRKTINK